MTRAAVLSAGGFAGGAWMLGLVDGLRSEGIDLGEADLLVGTSAGARTAAQVATGGLDAAVELLRRADAPRLDFPATLEQFLATAMRIAAEAGDEREAARRLANIGPLGETLVTDAERRRVIAAHVPAREWPDLPLMVTAVDARTGGRATFDASSGVALHDALAATSALPGIIELAEIGGRRYADGGVHSVFNADLADGHDVVLVVSPLPALPQFQARLDRELETLGKARVRVVRADDESLAAIGPNSLDPLAAPAALEAGRAQATRELEGLRALWSSIRERS
jgi:NTE family protein